MLHSRQNNKKIKHQHEKWKMSATYSKWQAVILCYLLSFLFHLKSSFHSQDIYVFVMTFWSRLISKSMTSQPGQQTIAIHILPNISRSKGNQTMKFGQLIEYNMRNTFAKKSYTKCAGETIPRPWSKVSKLSISLDQ